MCAKQLFLRKNDPILPRTVPRSGMRTLETPQMCHNCSVVCPNVDDLAFCPFRAILKKMLVSRNPTRGLFFFICFLDKIPLLTSRKTSLFPLHSAILFLSLYCVDCEKFIRQDGRFLWKSLFGIKRRNKSIYKIFSGAHSKKIQSGLISSSRSGYTKPTFLQRTA